MKLSICFIFISLFTIACSQQPIKKQSEQDTVKQDNLQQSTQQLSTLAEKPSDVKNNAKLVDPPKTSPVTKKPVVKVIQKKPVPKIKPKKAVVQAKVKHKIPKVILEPAKKTDTHEVAIPELEVMNETEQKIEEEKKLAIAPVFSEKSFPVRYGSVWSLDRKKDSLTNQLKCILSARKKSFFDGYSESKMWLELSTNAFLVKTSSTVDLSYPSVGIYVDQNKPILHEGLFSTSHVYNKKNIKNILKSFEKGSNVIIKLGFWPTWPQTKTSAISFSLYGFNQAIQGLKACDKI